MAEETYQAYEVIAEGIVIGDNIHKVGDILHLSPSSAQALAGLRFGQLKETTVQEKRGRGRPRKDQSQQAAVPVQQEPSPQG